MASQNPSPKRSNPQQAVLDALTDEEFGAALGVSWSAMTPEQRRRYPHLTAAEWITLESSPSPERPLPWIPDSAFRPSTTSVSIMPVVVVIAVIAAVVFTSIIDLAVGQR